VMDMLRRIALAILSLVVVSVATPAAADSFVDKRVRQILMRAGVHVGEVDYLVLRLNSAAMENGLVIDNNTNNVLTLAENGEDLTLTFGTNTLTFDSSTGATYVFTPAVGITGILTLSDALTLSNGATVDQSANNVLTFAENSEDWELTFASNSVTMASTTGALLTITPATTITGDLTLNGGAGALTFGTSGAILANDNVAAGLDIGTTGATALGSAASNI